MSFYTQKTIKQINKVAIIDYLDYDTVYRWNHNVRTADQLRAVTGWYWQSKRDPRDNQQGFKTLSAARRDAYHALILKKPVPDARRRSGLKLVKAA